MRKPPRLRATSFILRGAVPRVMAIAGMMAVCGTTAHAAEDRAVLKLRGVIHKSVTVTLAPDGVGGQFADPARTLRISEETNFASPYHMYLEGSGMRAVFDGRPVAFDGGRGLLEAQGLGQDGRTTRRTRALALRGAAPATGTRPYVLVVSIP